jgi:hypothetical protein
MMHEQPLMIYQLALLFQFLNVIFDLLQLNFQLPLGGRNI